MCLMSMVNKENLSPGTEFLERKRGMGSQNEHGARGAEGEAKFSAVAWIRKAPSDFDQPRKVLQGLERAADMGSCKQRKKTRDVWRGSERCFGSRI